MTDSPGQPPRRPGPAGGQPRPPVVPGRPAFPGAAPTAPSFDDEISAAVSYEKGLAVKALVAIALVLIVLSLRQFVFT
jgi:hypothetical protein